MDPKYVFAFTCFVCSVIAGCGGRSQATGEVVGLGDVCKRERHKLVAVEGYLAPNSTTCEVRKKRNASTGTVISCTLNLYESPSLSGQNVPVRIQTTGWPAGSNNGIEPPAEGKAPVIYDNDANPVDVTRKLRIHGQLDNNDRCILGGVERIDQL